MDKLKRTLVTLLACFTVLCLSVGMIPWGKVVTPTTAKAETQADGYDLDGDGTINYVAFGDSVTNGYGHPGYYLALQKH